MVANLLDELTALYRQANLGRFGSYKQELISKVAYSLLQSILVLGYKLLLILTSYC